MNKIDFFALWAVPQGFSKINTQNIYSLKAQKEFARELSKKASLPDVSESQRHITDLVIGISGGRINTTASPFLYTVAGLLSSGDYEQDLLGFTIFSLICLIFSILILCRVVNFSITSSLLILILFGTFYVPILSDMQAGNINHIQLLVITIYIVCSKSRRPAFDLFSGIVLGTGFVLKPNIFMIFVLGIILTLADKEFKRFFRVLPGFCLGAVFCISISGIYFGRMSIWEDFLLSLPNTLNMSYPLIHGNIGLASLIFYLTKTDASFVIFGVIFFAFLAVAWTSERNPGNKEIKTTQEYAGKSVPVEVFSAAGIGCTIMLLSAGLAWAHYYVLLIPLIIFMIRPLDENNNEDKKLMAVRFIAFTVILLFTSVCSSMVGYTAFHQSILFNTATVLLLIITLYELWYQRTKKRDQTDIA